MKHDVALWQTVQATRKANGHGLDCGAFFMTVDHNFAAFDREVKKRQSSGNRDFPESDASTLKPFMANEVGQFMETFALPEFRIAKTTPTQCPQLSDQFAYGPERRVGHQDSNKSNGDRAVVANWMRIRKSLGLYSKAKSRGKTSVGTEECIRTEQDRMRKRCV